MTGRVEEDAAKVGLRINADKNKLIVIGNYGASQIIYELKTKHYQKRMNSAISEALLQRTAAVTRRSGQDMAQQT